MDKKTIKYLIIFGIIILIVGAGGFFAWQRGWILQKPSSTLTQDQTANWQTYRNDEYGFEIKYPSYGKVLSGFETYTNININIPTNVFLVDDWIGMPPAEEGTDIIGRGVVMASYQRPVGETECYLENLGLFDYLNPNGAKNLTINGVSFKHEEGGNFFIPQVDWGDSYSTFKNGKCIFVIFDTTIVSAREGITKHYDPQVGDPKETDIYNTILSTFKFTK